MSKIECYKINFIPLNKLEGLCKCKYDNICVRLKKFISITRVSLFVMYKKAAMHKFVEKKQVHNLGKFICNL